MKHRFQNTAFHWCTWDDIKRLDSVSSHLLKSLKGDRWILEGRFGVCGLGKGCLVNVDRRSLPRCWCEQAGPLRSLQRPSGCSSELILSPLSLAPSFHGRLGFAAEQNIRLENISCALFSVLASFKGVLWEHTESVFSLSKMVPVG